jgi:TonB family protein
MKRLGQSNMCLIQVLAGLGLMLVINAAMAQMGPGSIIAKQAYESGDHAGCAYRYEDMLASEPFPTSSTRLLAARCLALAGQQDRALSVLRTAIEHPVFREHDLVAADKDFVSLHATPAWPELMELASRQSALPEPMGSGVNAKYMRRHLPNLPRGLLRQGEMRALTLIVWVAPDAMPTRVDIEKSSGSPQLDAIAIEAAKSWKYMAAVSNGRTFGYPTRIPLTFAP